MYLSIDTKNFELQPEETELVALIQKTDSVIRHQALKKGLSFGTEVGDNIPKKVKVDIDKLLQVLLNLLANAVKFTEKGNIDLQLKLIEKDDEKARIIFQITDTGIGIRKKDKGIIFKPLLIFYIKIHLIKNKIATTCND